MKKWLIFICVFFIQIGFVQANEKIPVTLSKCVDGDTAKFNLNEETITVRFLAIDTPESVHPTKGIEPYGKEASTFTCEKLENAKKIELEYDENSDKLDKYDRHLAWVFVDDYLLQDLIIKEGLAEVAYLYGDYKYTSILEEHQTLAEINKVGMWQENNTKEEVSNGEQEKEEQNTATTQETEEKEPWYYTVIITTLAILIVLKKKKII